MLKKCVWALWLWVCVVGLSGAVYGQDEPTAPGAPAATQEHQAPDEDTGETPHKTLPDSQSDAQAEGESHVHGVPDVHPFWIIPFVLLLGSIAIMPLVNHKFWEHNYPWFAYILGSITAVYYLFIFDHPAARGAWLHEMQEYVSFIALLGSLYIVSGGIVIHVSRRATPTTNTVLLLVGAVIANIVGTTGAAMLLIRPFMRINRAHIKPYHIIFFIFIVANCGGALTPIGDPPLFMGYLKGVPFFWVAEAVWPAWVVCVAVLLAVFFIIDKLDHAKTQRHHEHDAGPAVEIFGFQNFVFIAVILIGVFQPSLFQMLHDGAYLRLPLSREVLMVIAAVVSKLTTKPYIYERNEFNYHPIKEVAILFVGIFATMVPALNYLNRHADQMPLKTPGQYYFITGSLSAVLDNAPTYLVFLETNRGTIKQQYQPELKTVRYITDQWAQGRKISTEDIEAHYRDQHGNDGLPETEIEQGIARIKGAYLQLQRHRQKELMAGQVTDDMINIALLIGSDRTGLYLMAISIAAVFFGACTYIGNGPNFMVKSIAEANGIHMPSFFGYFLRFALPILIPLYVLIWLLFFVLRIGA